MTVLFLPFWCAFLVFLHLVWFLWLGLPVLCGIKVVKVGIFVLFLILEEMPWNISPFTFKVIIGGYVLAAFLVNYFLVFFICCCSFLLLLSFLLIWWLFLVLHFESFLFFMCLSIIDFWFVVSNHVYQSMCIHS